MLWRMPVAEPSLDSLPLDQRLPNHPSNTFPLHDAWSGHTTQLQHSYLIPEFGDGGIREHWLASSISNRLRKVLYRYKALEALAPGCDVWSRAPNVWVPLERLETPIAHEFDDWNGMLHHHHCRINLHPAEQGYLSKSNFFVFEQDLPINTLPRTNNFNFVLIMGMTARLINILRTILLLSVWHTHEKRLQRMRQRTGELLLQTVFRRALCSRLMFIQT